MDNKAKLLLKLAFSISLILAIFYLIGFQEIIDVLLRIDIPLLLLALLAYVLVNLSMCLRIKMVLESMGERLSVLGIFPSNLAGMLSSDFTPARVGYFFTAFSLTSRFSIKIEKTILSIFGPQLLDFVIKLFSATMVVMIVVGRLGAEGLLFNAFFIICALSVIIFAGLLVFYPPFLGMLSFMEHLPFVSKGFSFLKKMHEHSDRLLSIKWRILGITLLSWTLKGLEWLLLARALGITISDSLALDLLYMMLFQAAITILQFLPLPTLAGAGASEAGSAAVLLFFGIPLEVSVTFAFMTRLVMIALDVLALPVLYDFIQKHGIDGLLSRLSNKII